MPADLHHHKNNFFLGTFSHKEAGMSLREYLPPSVSQSIEWSSLQLESGSFVDSTLRNRETDILYSVKRCDGADGFVYVLFEHQSEEDKWMPFRLLTYMVRIWENYRKQNAKAKCLPVIVPIVLHQGRSGWKKSMDFTRFFEVGDDSPLKAYLPDFRSEMISLPALSEEEIKGDAYVQVAFRLMKAIRSGNMRTTFGAIESFLVQISNQRNDTEFALTCFTYALQADNIDKPQLQDTFRSIQNPQLRKTAMTVAEQLIDEGRQEGRQKGILEGLKAGIIEVLELRFSSIPEGLRCAILAVDSPSHLRQLHRASVTCTSLEEFSKAL